MADQEAGREVREGIRGGGDERRGREGGRWIVSSVHTYTVHECPDGAIILTPSHPPTTPSLSTITSSPLTHFTTISPYTSCVQGIINRGYPSSYTTC